MQRRLRVCCELPPRHSLGAASITSTEAPLSFAVSAAHSAAFPTNYNHIMHGFLPFSARANVALKGKMK